MNKDTKKQKKREKKRERRTDVTKKMKYATFFWFLVACTRLYTPLCRSVRPSVGPSVRPSVRHTLLFLLFNVNS